MRIVRSDTSARGGHRSGEAYVYGVNQASWSAEYPRVYVVNAVGGTLATDFL
jgi:hypothetical protein